MPVVKEIKNSKKKVLISFREGGENGGPYNSHKRIINSKLKEKYEFIPLMIPKGKMGALNIKLILKLTKKIKKINPDIFHFTGLELIGFYCIISSRLAGIKNTILAIHGSSLEAQNISLIKKAILYLYEKITIILTKKYYCVSKYVENWERLKKHKNKSQGIIYNICDLKNNRNNRNNKKIKMKEKLGIKNDEIVIVSTGRITKEKGFHILLEVIKKVVKKNLKCKFLIVGSGNYYYEMEKEIIKLNLKNKVLMVGYQNKIDEFLEISDIFILCSLHETFCMSILEAAIYKLPVIAPKVGGIPEIIKENENGFLIKKNDIGEYTKKLEFLVKNSIDRKIMGEKSCKLINENFSTELILNKIDKLYQEILSN